MKRFLPLAAVFLSSPAFAHHAMGGEVPQTLFQGLLSGLAHPVIGIDHLAFIVLVGIAAAASGRVLAAPLAFIAATLAGTAIHLAGVGLPLAELVITASIIVLGVFLAMGRQVAGPLALASFAFAGIFHGWAYGEAVVGSTPGPIGAYLLGFGVVQFAIAAGIGLSTRSLLQVPRGQVQARVASAVCMGVGLAFFVETVEQLLLG